MKKTECFKYRKHRTMVNSLREMRVFSRSEKTRITRKELKIDVLSLFVESVCSIRRGVSEGG